MFILNALPSSLSWHEHQWLRIARTEQLDIAFLVRMFPDFRNHPDLIMKILRLLFCPSILSRTWDFTCPSVRLRRYKAGAGDKVLTRVSGWMIYIRELLRIYDLAEGHDFLLLSTPTSWQNRCVPHIMIQCRILLFFCYSQFAPPWFYE